jgi:uncharacterized protein YqgC (DUF456 family)|tara:strand:- start:1195 stop:1383 length:189 start_codon:yes stop_codon:yes gene_type:complete
MNHKLKKIFGVILIILGVLGGAVPIVQGWLLILLGLALLESAYANKQIARIKKWMNQVWKKK